MKFTRLSLVCLLVSLLSSVGWAKKFKSMKVSDYKNLRILVEGVNENKLGLTTELVERAIKLRLLQNGIKPTTEGFPNYLLYVRVDILASGDAFDIDVMLKKSGRVLGLAQTETGTLFSPEQGLYSTFGTPGEKYSFIIKQLNNCLDSFMLDYLESNIE